MVNLFIRTLAILAVCVFAFFPMGGCDDETISSGTGSGSSCPPGTCSVAYVCCPTDYPWSQGTKCFVSSADCHAYGATTCYECN